MDKTIATYIRKHTVMVTVVIVVGFVLLAIGEYILYRKYVVLSQMVSEGFMQVKDGLK